MITQDSKINVTSGSEKEWKLLPKDVFQFEVLDLELKEQKAYQSEVLETVVSFTFVCLEEGEFYGRRMWKTVTLKLTAGTKPSNLYQIFSALTEKTYSPEELKEIAKKMDADFFNSFIKAQLRLTLGQGVGSKGEQKNVIEGFLPKKQLLPAFDASKVKRAE